MPTRRNAADPSSHDDESKKNNPRRVGCRRHEYHSGELTQSAKEVETTAARRLDFDSSDESSCDERLCLGKQKIEVMVNVDVQSHMTDPDAVKHITTSTISGRMSQTLTQVQVDRILIVRHHPIAEAEVVEENYRLQRKEEGVVGASLSHMLESNHPSTMGGPA